MSHYRKLCFANMITSKNNFAVEAQNVISNIILHIITVKIHRQKCISN